MRDEMLAPLDVLDETSPVVRRAAAPWLGVLWAGTLPLRLVQVWFFRDIFGLGADLRDYGNHLEALAWAWVGALLPAVYARGVFARACHLSLRSGRPAGREAWRLPPAQLMNLFYTALLAELLFGALLWTWVGVPLALLVGALAVATAHRCERPGLIAPLREIAAGLGPFKTVTAALFTFAVAFIVVFVNVYFLGRALAWLGGSFAGVDAARWDHLLRPNPFVPVWPAESLTRWLCLGGTALFLEPFWLAAFCVLSHRMGLRQSGDDLRAWYRRLRGAP